MLLELNITDFAIIDRLNLALREGFNVLTGETGAGKSIIIDALGTLRGDRPDATFVRAGAERARIEGVFSTHDCPGVLPLLEEYGLLEPDEETLILSREINAGTGRSVARINGRAINSSVLRTIGGKLVDIHGQHEGLSLFNTRTHIDMLDRFGGLLPLRDQVAALVVDIRRVGEELAQLRDAAARRGERIEELRFLLEDVQSAKLRPGEEQALLQERTLVQNGARITDLVTRVYSALYAGEEAGRAAARPIVETMGEVCTALEELARIDTQATRLAEQTNEALYILEDLASGVRTYRDSMEFDVARLDVIEDRLTLIRDMERKYRGNVEQILERAASAEAEIERLTNSAEHMADLEAQAERLRVAAGDLADQLSQRRRAVGDTLASGIEEAMRDLAMVHVRFHVGTTQSEDANGVPLSSKNNGSAPLRYAIDKTGADRVEFLLSPNPGEPLKPLARIASGGESARLLLALKSILSRVDEVPTLVFDEVDVGVGGRAGHVVGEKLWGISAQHQVICITHQPQVAAFADAHYTIAKEVVADRTRSSVTFLPEPQRPDEIAAMLDGTPVSEHSRRTAQQILERARTFKIKQRPLDQPMLAR